MGFLSKGAAKEVCPHRIFRRERCFQKGVKKLLSRIPEGFTLAVQDESIFVHDALVRRKMWTEQGARPVVTTTGSHQRTCVFGTLAMDGRQLFRQYDAFDQYAFIDYLKQVQRKFGKVILFTDRARQHRSKKVRGYLEENRDVIRIEYLPKGSPEFSAVEECWRQGKYDLLVSRYYPRFTDLKSAVAEYYRTRRFNLDIVTYLLRCL